MSILSELTELLNEFAPIETGVFSDIAPEEYIVITPMSDIYELFGDNRPEYETQEARLSIFSLQNYRALKNRVTSALLAADFTITDRRYIGREDDTGYFHYAVDTAKFYSLEE